MNTHVKKASDFALSLKPPAWPGWRGWPVLCALVLAVGAAILLLDMIIHQLVHGSAAMRFALLGGGTAAAATAVGTLPVLFAQNFSQRTYDSFLGFGAGVMLGATAFSLVVPAIAAARAGGAGPLSASMMAGAGIVAGAALIMLLDRLASNKTSLDGVNALAPDSQRRAWLFVAAVALHNLPEGLAIGVAYAGTAVEKAHSLTTGISIQDIPEGLVVALALRSVGYSRGFSVGLGMLSGITEPLAAAVGVALIGVSHGMLPIGLALAAGAMLFVIVHDMIPECHRNGYAGCTSAALVVGFTLMTILDTALG